MNPPSHKNYSGVDTAKQGIRTINFKKGSWQDFLQHLPVTNAPIVDYQGRVIKDQQKHVAILNFDVGKKDLQQCADALMRLRAEYLFKEMRFGEIGFHFGNGTYYTWANYCEGWRPLVKKDRIQFIKKRPSTISHETLRSYLDLVYTYAGTASLCKDLKPAEHFEVGTVVIKPGSPGHCFIIIDEGVTINGIKVFKLAEGFMPAQSIYILSNLYNEELSPWYELKPGTIMTSSYVFTSYKLGKFE